MNVEEFNFLAEVFPHRFLVNEEFGLQRQPILMGVLRLFARVVAIECGISRDVNRDEPHKNDEEFREGFLEVCDILMGIEFHRCV